MADIMPQTTDQTASLEQLDWSTPCSYARHPTFGSGPAVWMIQARSDVFCDCDKRDMVALLCDPCWKHLVAAGDVQCQTCGRIYPLLSAIKRVERI